MTLVFLIFLLMMTLPVAHGIGWGVSRRLRVKPGMARDVMPALPASPPRTGSAQRRWTKQLDQVEGKILAMFPSGGQRVEAQALAAQLGQDVQLVEAALARMREEIPCRLQITRQGKMWHDFAAADLAALRRRRQRAWPMKVLLLGVAAFANIGAAWPFLSMTFIAAASLFGMAAAPEGEALVVGVVGLIGAGLLFVVTFVSGFIMHGLLTPLVSGPRQGDVQQSEPRPTRTHGDASDDGLLWAWMAHSHHTTYVPVPVSSSSSSSSSWFGGGSSSSSLDLDSDDASGVLVVIVVILLLAVIAASLSALFFWLRGIWRAIKLADEPMASTSTTLWVRTSDAIDRVERYIPTNDLVIRALQALRRAYASHRPQDEDLAARVLILAKHHGGRVSALQIALHEGLDDNEAAEVGARLCGLVGGQILVSDAGELVFSFPEALLEPLVAQPDRDMWAEYTTFDASGRAMRRSNQRAKDVPVNLVGMTKGHLAATDRLVAGTYIMALMGLATLAPGMGLVELPWWLYLPAGLTLVAMALGAASLSALSRYTSAILAGQGVMRDARRATFLRVRAALERGQDMVDLTGLEDELLALYKPAWRGLTRVELAREVRGVCVDLDLEPVMDERALEGAARFDLSGLRRRLNALQGVEGVLGEIVLDHGDEAEDVVIFDSRIEHDEQAVQRSREQARAHAARP